MQIWLLDAVIFAAGICCGISLARLWARPSSIKRRGRDLRAARHQILAGLKETHDEEILHEAFRATEALRSELSKSLHRLRSSMNLMVTPAPQPDDKEPSAAAERSSNTGTESLSPTNR